MEALEKSCITNREKFTDNLTVKITLKSNGNYETYHFDTKRKALDFYNRKTIQCGDTWKVELL